MMVTKKSLPRRTFLRGLGTTLALPLFDAMVPAFAGPATNAAKAPIRLGFVYHPTGMIMSKWTPAAEGTAFEITPTMAALEPFRDRLLVPGRRRGLAAFPSACKVRRVRRAARLRHIRQRN